MGITQYHWRNYYPEIGFFIQDIIKVLKSAAIELLAVLHIDSVVADVYIEISSPDNNWVLIELNPFLEYTGACLFDWRNGGDFDNTFRYITTKGHTLKAPL